MNVESYWLLTGNGRLTAMVERDLRHNVISKILLVLLMAVPAGQVMAQAAETGQATASDCKCRSPDGQMQDLGTVQCVDIVGRKNLVRCEMSTNTPYWNKVEGASGCPDA